MPASPHIAPKSAVASLSDQLWFSCPSCKGELKVPVELADSTGSCPLCGKKVHIPAKCQKYGGGALATSTPTAVSPASADPELDEPERNCFSADLDFSVTVDAVAPKKGFFDLDPPPQPKAKPAAPASGTESKPSFLLDQKAPANPLDVPLRKFAQIEPEASQKAPLNPAPELRSAALLEAEVSKKAAPFAPVKATQPVELPKAAPTKASEPPKDKDLGKTKTLPQEVVGPVQLEQGPLFSPIRKYPPKQRRRGVAKPTEPIPDAVLASPPALPGTGVDGTEPKRVTTEESPNVPEPIEPAPPVVQAPVAPPVVSTPVAPPVVQAPVAPPVVSTPVAPPVVQAPVAPPVAQVPVAPPVAQVPVAPPVVQVPVAAPVVPDPAPPPSVVPVAAKQEKLAQTHNPNSVTSLSVREVACMPIAPAPALNDEWIVVEEPPTATKGPVQPPSLQPPEVTIPVVIGDTDYEPEPGPRRIGGVLIASFTHVPRKSQVLLWARRAALFLLFLSPFVAMSDLYMPYVRQIWAAVEEAKASHLTLAEIQQQTAANRHSSAAQGLRKDAEEALRHEWSKFTASMKAQPSASPPQAHLVAFRASRTEAADSNPEKDWPQLLMRNYGTFIGHTPMDGASSFIIESSDGVHWVATSARLLGPSGGVEPPLPPGKMAAALHRWRAFPPDKPDTFAEISGGRGLNCLVTSDWLAMRLPSNDSVLPVKPLHLRRKALKPGEVVYLVGLPYDDQSGATQHVYRGQVTPSTGALDAGQFAFEVDAAVDFSGFRGAPVLDGESEVVGVLTDRWATGLVGTRAELLVQLIEGK